jgi:hypothetical protein
MNWIRLTHYFKNTTELWIDFDEVVHIERDAPKKTVEQSGIIVPGQDEAPATNMVFKSGRQTSAVETPAEIFALAKKQ